MKRTVKRIDIPVMATPALERLRGDLVKYMETDNLNGAINGILNNRELSSYFDANLPEHYGLEFGIKSRFTGCSWEKIWTNEHYGLTRSLVKPKQLALFQYSSKYSFIATEEFSHEMHNRLATAEEFCYNLVEHALKYPQHFSIDLGDYNNPWTGKPIREKSVKVTA